MSSIDIANACDLSSSEPIGTTSLEAASCNFSHVDNLSISSLTETQNRAGNTVKTVTGYSQCILNPTNAIYEDAPFNSVTYGRMGGVWVSLDFRINYVNLAGEQFMECGEAQAFCGGFSGFSPI